VVVTVGVIVTSEVAISGWQLVPDASHTVDVSVCSVIAGSPRYVVVIVWVMVRSADTCVVPYSVTDGTSTHAMVRSGM